MIKMFFSGIIGVLLLIASFPAAAETANKTLELDIETSIALALAHNRDFQLEALETESDKIAYKNRIGSFIPDITASSGLNYNDIAFSGLTDPNASYGDDPLSFNAGLSVSLNLNNKLKYDIQKTRLDYEEGEISYETARKKLIRDVEKEFYYLLTLRSNLKILEKNRNLAEKRSISTQTNYENGFATDLEVMQAEVNAASYQPRLSQARSDLDTASRNFLLLLGLDVEPGVILTGDLNIPPFYPDRDDLIKTYTMSRQDIQKQMIEIESLKNKLKITKASAYSPSLTIGSNWSSNIASPFESSSWESERWSDTGTVGLSLSIPLDGYIKGSVDKTDIAQDKIDIKKTEIILAAMIESSKVEIMNLCQQISTSLEKLKQSSRNRDLAEKSYKLTEESYSFGRVERLDVEDAQQSALSAGQEYLSSQYDYMTELIELKYALNLNSMEELFELNTKGEKENGN